jgi:replicative DNA helicase
VTIETTILAQLVHNPEYVKKVLPHLRLSYFGERTDKTIFRTFVEYHQKYNHSPNLHELEHEISEREDISDDDYEQIIHKFKQDFHDEEPDFDWMVDKTESWCQERAMYNGIMKSISIIDGEDEKHSKHAIPDLLKEALAVSFDTAIGHDYLEDATARFEFYNEEHERIPFNLKMLNKVTNGGVPRKTLNIILAGTNVGKTLAMVHMAANYMQQGLNVLYITLEMAEEWIANRVDANLMDMTVKEVEDQSSFDFYKNIGKIKTQENVGKLIVKEYPTASAHCGHFKQLMEELKLKKKFKPDVILVDYIGICASSRVKIGQSGSYFYIKAIAEELRGLAVETNTALWSAVQVNRTGFSSSDPDLTDTAESFGLPATADFMIGLIRTEELDALGQILCKQLKSRYGDKNKDAKFVLGVDPAKMQLFDVEDSAQSGLVQPSAPNIGTQSKFAGIGT